MKLQCDREALLEACQFVGHLAEERSPRPILRNLRIFAGEAGLQLTATNLDAGARARVENVNVQEPGQALAPAAVLTQILREVRAEMVDIHSEDAGLRLGAGRSQFRLVGDDPEQYPNVSEFLTEGTQSLPRRDLAEMIEMTTFATASEATRYSLNGVLVVFQPGVAEFVATDGRRMSLVRKKIPGLRQMGDGAIVPTEAMGLIQRLLGGGDDEVAVVLGESEVAVQSANALVTTRLVEGHFPPYQDVIPKDADKKVPLQVGVLLSALRQARILTSEESRAVRMHFTADKLVLRGSAAETGEATVEVDITYGYPELEIGFNPVLLEDALRRLPVDGEVSLELSEAARPAVLRFGEEFTYVVMPVTLV
jgi:DNA polymerase-3 subunit beta